MSNKKVTYVSVDIETTGLDPDIHSIIEIAAVAWENDGPISEQPKFQTLVKLQDDVVWNPYALEMNQKLKAMIDEGQGIWLWTALDSFRLFLESIGVTPENQIHIIGQNFASFDLQFLNKSERWPSDIISYRYFDTGTAYATEEGMISLSKLPVPPDSELKVTHRALEDAQVTLYHARKALKQKNNTVYSLTRSGEHGILGVFTSEDAVNAAKAQCSYQDELVIEAYELDSF